MIPLYPVGHAATSATQVSFWNMDEATGATRVDCKRGANLTNNNSAAQAAGFYGNCTTFNGTTQSLSTTNTLLARGNQNFGIGGFFRRTGGGATTTIAQRYGAAGAREWQLIYDATNDDWIFKIYNSADASDTVTIHQIVATSTWVYVTGWNDLSNNLIGISLYYGLPSTATYTAQTAAKTRTISNVAVATEFGLSSQCGLERFTYYLKAPTQVDTDIGAAGTQLCV